MRRLRAVLLLVGVLAVPPAILLSLVGSPLRPPATLRHLSGLTSPVDDATVLWLLALAAWLWWLHLLACLAVETVQQTRGARLRMPLPGLMFGANSLLASHLIAALMLSSQAGSAVGLSTFQGSFSATSTGTPVAPSGSLGQQLIAPGIDQVPVAFVTGPAGAATRSPEQEQAARLGGPGGAPGPSRPTGSAASAPASGLAAEPIECRVLPPHGRHHDTLWGIAERHLGDGLRWREVFALNDGRLMPDGHRLTDASRIRPGWILRLPADARELQVDQLLRPHPSPDPDPLPISRSEQGTATADVPDAGIHQGGRLDSTTRAEVPAIEHRPADPDNTGGAAPKEPRSEPQRGADEPAAAATSAPTPASLAPEPVRPAARGDAGHGRPPVAGSASAPGHDRPTGTGAASAASAAASTESVARTTDGHSEDAPAGVATAEAVGLGSLAVSALALLAALTRRRKVAARRRPPGVRAARPAPELLAAETQLRRQARAADIAATIRLALLLATPHNPDTRVKAVWEHPDGSIELVLTSHHPDRVPSPFLPAGRGWLLPRDSHRLLFALRTPTGRRTDRDVRLDHELTDRTDPCPLLLPVGEQDGSACLVNLELFGLISLTTTHETPSLETLDTTDASTATSAAASEVLEQDASGTAVTPLAPAGLAAPPPALVELLAGWVVTLAGAPWAELVHLHIPLSWQDLSIGQEHVHPIDPRQRQTLPQPLSRHERDGLTGHLSLEAARRAQTDLADVIIGEVTLGHPIDELPGWLLQAAQDPLDPNVVILTEPHPAAHGWRLSSDGLLAIPGVAERLTPLRLDPSWHQLVLRLLEYTQDPPQADPDDPHLDALERDCPALTEPQMTAAAPADQADRPGTIDASAHLATEAARPDTDADSAVGAGPATAAEDRDPTPDVVADEPTERGSESAAADQPPPAPPGSDTAPPLRAVVTEPPPPTQQEDGRQRRLAPVEVGVLGPIIISTATSTATAPAIPTAIPDPVPDATGSDSSGALSEAAAGEVDAPAQLAAEVALPQPRLQALEMLVYLCLHRQPIRLEAMSEVIWPDRGYHDRTVSNRIGDLRRYLGDGHLEKAPGNRWQLTDLVTSDWQRFKTLARGNPSQQLQALRLVRGIPFAQCKPDWMMLDGTFAEIEASIVDLALLVGQRALKTGNYLQARDAAHAGILGCPFDERLYRVGIESAAARNATAEIRHLTNQLNWVMDTEIDPDDTLQPATTELLQRLRDDADRERYRQRRNT